MSPDLLGPLMFGALIVFLLFGYPVAFSLAANGLLFAFVGIEMGLLTPDLLRALPQRIWGIMQNETLLAIPFFTFMGLILERSGMAEDLLDTIGQLFGPIRGGMAFAVIFVGALLAATTGVVAASVISMGLISLPIMLRYGYDRRLATGVIAASGTLAQIIPPSLVLIVMADLIGIVAGGDADELLFALLDRLTGRLVRAPVDEIDQRGRAAIQRGHADVVGSLGRQPFAAGQQPGVRHVHVRVDTAGNDDHACRIDRARRCDAIQRSGRCHGRDRLTLDADIRARDTLRCHDIAAANDEVEHGAAPGVRVST